MGAPTRNSFGTDGVIGDMAKPARVEQTWGQVSAQVVLVRLVASVVVTVRRSHGNEENRDPQHILPPRPIAVAAASSKRRGASEIVPSRARATPATARTPRTCASGVARRAPWRNSRRTISHLARSSSFCFVERQTCDAHGSRYSPSWCNATVWMTMLVAAILLLPTFSPLRGVMPRLSAPPASHTAVYMMPGSLSSLRQVQSKTRRPV